jgi:hypothetical protein
MRKELEQWAAEYKSRPLVQPERLAPPNWRSSGGIPGREV